MQAEQTFRPPVQLVRLLYCYQLLSLEHIYIHLSLRGCFQSLILQVFRKIISRPLPAIQICQRFSLQWELAQLRLNCQGENGMKSWTNRLFLLLCIIQAVYGLKNTHQKMHRVKGKPGAGNLLQLPAMRCATSAK